MDDENLDGDDASETVFSVQKSRIIEQFEIPAEYVSYVGVIGFGDGTLRLAMGEHVSESDIMYRGMYRMTLQKGRELAIALHNMIDAAEHQQELLAAERKKMN